MCLIALAVLFCTRWLFCSLGLGFVPDPLCFAAESLFFLLLFGLGLYGVPSPVPEVCLVFGAGVLGVLYTVRSKSIAPDMMRLFSVLPAFVYYTERCGSRRKKTDLLPFCVRIYMILSTVAGYPFVITVLRRRYGLLRLPSGSGVFSVVWLLPALLGCAALLFAAIRRRAPKTADPASRRQSLRAILWAALSLVSVAENAVYLSIYENKQALDLLPLLWISCWILLAAQEDPLLSPIAARLRRLFTRFLMDPKNSGDAAKEEKVL